LRTGAVPPDLGTNLPELPRLAVLPFRNLGHDTGQTYFAEGLVEDLITALSRFRSFTVVSRAASPSHGGMDARHAALEYRARYILEGTVRRAGDRLRLTAKLVDGESGTPLWAEQFDGSLDVAWSMPPATP
jgi:TolB-like protein